MLLDADEGIADLGNRAEEAYPVFLFLVNAGLAVPAAAVVIALNAVAFRAVLRWVDWPLLLVFVLKQGHRRLHISASASIQGSRRLSPSHDFGALHRDSPESIFSGRCAIVIHCLPVCPGAGD